MCKKANKPFILCTIFLCMSIIFANFSSIVVFAQTNATLEIDLSPNSYIKPSTDLLLGTNDDWPISTSYHAIANSSSTKVSDEFVNFFQENAIPMQNSRQGGSSSNELDWSELVGPLDDRGGTERYIRNYGFAEWIKCTQAVNPNAAFTALFNINKPENSADLVRYLTLNPTDANAVNPDTGINWAQRRVDDGIKDPVNIIAFEIGNENYADYGVTDWNSLKLTESVIRGYAKDYVQKCKTIIDLTRSVNSEVKLSIVLNSAAQIASRSSILNRGYKCAQWWNDEIITSLADYNGGINYVSLHDYYYDTESNYYTKISNAYKNLITQYFNNHDIKILVTEHNLLDLYDRISNDPTTEQKIVRNKEIHSLKDCLFIAEYLNTIYNIPEVYSANLHGRFLKEYGSPFGIANKFTDDRIYPTPAGYVLSLLNEAVGGNVVKTTSSNIVSSAHLKDNKNLDVVLVNRNNSNDAQVSINIKNTDTAYCLQSVSTLSGNSIDAKNDPSTPDDANITRTLVNSTDTISSYSVPAHSMVVLHLVPQEADLLEDYSGKIECTQKDNTLYICDKLYGKKDYGTPLGAIVLKNGADEENYTYNDILCASQTNIYNNIAFFKIPMTKEFLTNSHKIIISGDSFKQVYTYTPNIITDVDITNAEPNYEYNGVSYPKISNNDYSLNIRPEFSSLILPDDDLYADIFYGDEKTDIRTKYISKIDSDNTNYSIYMPDDAIPGVYTLSLNVVKDGITKDTFTKKFYFNKPNEDISIVTPVHDENGNDITKQTITSQIFVDIKNNTDKTITLTAMLCGYENGMLYGYENGMLKATTKSNKISLAPYDSDIICFNGLNTNNIDTVKLLIWEIDQIRPLTNVYYIK